MGLLPLRQPGYIRCFDMSDFDKYDNERISDLELREETSDLCRDILMKRDRYKEPLTEEEQSFLDENQRDMFNADERKYYKAYLAEVQKQAAERVGDRPTAYPLVMQAWRLCRLMSLQAPDWFVRIEATYLAQAMVFHRFATTFHVLTALGPAHRTISSVLSSTVKLIDKAYLGSVTLYGWRSLQQR